MTSPGLNHGLFAADSACPWVCGGSEPVVLGRARGSSPAARLGHSVHSFTQHPPHPHRVVGNQTGSQMLVYTLQNYCSQLVYIRPGPARNLCTQLLFERTRRVRYAKFLGQFGINPMERILQQGHKLYMFNYYFKFYIHSNQEQIDFIIIFHQIITWLLLFSKYYQHGFKFSNYPK